MTDLVFKSAIELGKLLKARKVSSTELLDACLTQFMRHNTRINAVVVAELDRAKRTAAAADKRLAKGEALSPFDGVPMTIKESFDWAGLPSTWGDPKLRDNVPEQDAAVLTRMEAAGAVPIGKTNVPLHLADWQSFNTIYGTTNNPWDVTRTPGGSSGGAAAALATGMSAMEVGSDIGSSIRNPAHFCGVCGHKPTFGVVPYRGHMMPGSVATSDITVAGPMARSANDLSAMMQVLAGTDGIEARGHVIELPKSRRKSLKDFKVAVKLSSSVSEVDQTYQDLIIDLAHHLKRKVKQLSHDANPAFSDAEAYENFILLLRATSTKRMPQIEYDAAFARAKTFQADNKTYVAMMNRAFAMSHRDWLRNNERRHQMRILWDDFFQDWDVMLCPVAASAAWPHDQKGERHERLIQVNDKKVSTIDQRFWAGFSGNFYLPSTVVPIGFTPEGLPCGIQIIAREYGDNECLRFAELIEEEFGGFVPPPGFAM
jgi:amidase